MIVKLATTVITFCLYAFLTVNGWAHGDVHEQIEALTVQIGRSPKNAELYIKRAELYRVHSEFSKALADLNRAESLSPNNVHLLFLQGRTLAESKKEQEAIKYLNQFLERKPDDPEGLRVRALALGKQGKFEEAAADLRRAIELFKTAQPELYVELAGYLKQTAPDGTKRALATLEEGIEKLGSKVISLQMFALDLEVDSKQYDAALKRIDSLIASTPRKERLLHQRGTILTKAGRQDEATESFKAALASIRNLKSAQRKTRAIVQLERDLTIALQNNPAK